MLTYNGSINPNTPVFNPAQSLQRLTAAAPPKYTNPGVQNHFADLYRGSGQQAAVDMDRAYTQEQNQYYLAGQQAINQNVLQGLSLAGQQQQDSADRGLAMQGQKYKMLGDIFGGGGLLGGLL